ncbi:lysozyme inhibitor LprI family protein [Novosphingobium sp. P6W]|uniref:lysozyme inhibitor LprI family protein n=1 Tax=Novosphingobium sp. P6W TaxID=1609758 RepID=UPI0013B41ABA|nr:hypothetical protein [Novosphingobium sp. P6W]
MTVRNLSACAAIGPAALLPTETPAMAAAPSFDCRKASSHNEKLICANAGLAALDRQIAERYRTLLTQLDSASAKLLKQDQQWFMAGGDDTYMDPRSAKDLADTLRRCLAFLNAIRLSPPAGVIGKWRNVTGEIEIRRSPSGTVSFAANTSEPSVGRWVCDAQGSAAADAQGRWTARITEPTPSRIALGRAGPMLAITQSDAEPGYWGHNGSLSGEYFFVGPN